MQESTYDDAMPEEAETFKMDVKDAISEIAKHVDQESQQESKAMEELLKGLAEVSESCSLGI